MKLVTVRLIDNSNHLNTRLVRYSDGRFVSSCQTVRYSNGGLKTGLKKDCLRSKMSSHVTLPFEYRTSKLSDIEVSSIQMVTVVRSLDFTFYSLKAILLPN